MATAAQQAYNVGRDAVLRISVGGSVVAMALLTKFDAKQDVVKLKSKPLNSPPIFQNVPDGWSGSFEIDRVDSTLDDLIASLETAYWGGDDASSVTILQTIADAAVGAVGAIHQFRFSGVQIDMDQAGTYEADAKVSQKLSFVASTRVKVS